MKAILVKNMRKFPIRTIKICTSWEWTLNSEGTWRGKEWEEKKVVCGFLNLKNH